MLTATELAELNAKLAPLSAVYETVHHLKERGRLDLEAAEAILGDVGERCRAIVTEAAGARADAGGLPPGLRFILFNRAAAEVFDSPNDLLMGIGGGGDQLAHDVLSWAVAATAGAIGSFEAGKAAFSVMAVLPEWIEPR